MFPSSAIIQADVIDGLSKVADKSQSLIISSPPYNIRKPYERSDKRSTEQYIEWQRSICSKLIAKLADDGSICWQVGNHVRDNQVIPLDYVFYDIFVSLGMKLRNRIIWRFNFGLHSQQRLSGRYETILWFTKSDSYKFNLDRIRIPQLYPGKRHSTNKGDRAGLPSGNPSGKNPSDFWEFAPDEAFISQPIWDVPNVKSNHPERTDHPCQYPIEIAERCILAFTDKGNSVLDPFLGAGSTALAALKNGRASIGIEREASYVKLSQERIEQLKQDSLPYRPLGKPVMRPPRTQRVAQRPAEWEPGE